MTRAFLLASVLGVLVASRGAAQEPVGVRLFGEPTTYTNVVDAFDDGDPWDVNVHLGFERTLHAASLQREITDGDGRTTRNVRDIGEYERIRNTLLLGLDVGLYKDLALFARLPVILSDDQSIALPASRDRDAVAADLAVPEGEGTAPLFSVPFRSPTRFGVDTLALGAAYAILSQERDPAVPTWVALVEFQLAIGEPMHACYDDKPDEAGARCYGGKEPGVGQGMHALKFDTRASRRLRHFEPYLGFSFLYRWPGPASELMTPAGDLDGYVNTAPPSEGTLTLGTALFPWEERAAAQRLTVDFRALGTFVSEGRGYTPLTDALGSSQASALRGQTPACATCDQTDTFYGLTDTQAHARLGGRVALELQVAEYIRFVAGAQVGWSTAYLLTQADACNSSAGDATGDARQGTCRSGIQNPHHRPAIDGPGQRLRAQGEVVVDLFASAVAQF